VVKGAARSASRKRLGIVLTILGAISSISMSVLWVLYGGLAFKVLAIVGTLTLALGLVLFRPVRFLEGEP